MWKSHLNGKVDARFLILINLPVLKLSLPLLLECDNDEGDKDVDKEEREDDEEDNVEDRHLCPEESSGANVFKSGPHRVLQDTKKEVKVNCRNCFLGKKSFFCNQKSMTDLVVFPETDLFQTCSRRTRCWYFSLIISKIHDQLEVDW